MRRRFLIVFNPGAGRNRRAALDAVLDAIRSADRTAEFAWCPALTADLARREIQARASGVDAVIAAGGDGTIRQAACALIDSDMPLGIVPLGTGNVLGHELAIPRDPAALARMLRAGPVTAVQAARANGEPFLLMAGAGFDGRVVAGLDHGWKQRVGKAAYVAPALAALARPLDRLDVSIDGAAPRTATWAVVANARHYGGRFVLAPRTRLLQPGLSCILFSAARRDVLARHLLALARGRLDRHADAGRGIEMVACDRVAITAATSVPAQIDGDAFGSTPLAVAANAGIVHLIVPG